MTAPRPKEQDEDELRAALLARLRLELILTKLYALQIERLGVALKHGLVSVSQALALDQALAIDNDTEPVE